MNIFFESTPKKSTRLDIIKAFGDCYWFSHLKLLHTYANPRTSALVTLHDVKVRKLKQLSDKTTSGYVRMVIR